MRSLLQQLENNEAILLMYLAGELPESDRQEVEELLARDAGLRAQLEALRTAQEQLRADLQELDEQAPPPVSDAVAQRQVSRILKQWHAERAVAAVPAEEQRRGLRYPWWVYPTASAAAILLAFLTYWGLTPADNSPMMSGPAPSRLMAVQAQETVQGLVQSFAASDGPMSVNYEHQVSLSLAEDELASLSHNRNDDWTMFGGGGADEE